MFLIVKSEPGRGPFAPERKAMSKPKDNSALSFIGQIQTEHKAVLKADGEALKHAIQCGKALNLAKENVLAAKGKWGQWREEHIPEISQQTASLYMRLAENEESVAECTSIREADLVLRVLNSGSRTKPLAKGDNEATADDASGDETDDDEAADTNNALLFRPGSPDLKATLQNTAVDEVYSALTQAWDRDHIRDLANRLLAYVRPAPSDLNIPSALRRPLTPAQPSQG